MLLFFFYIGCTQNEKQNTPNVMLEPVDVIAQGYGGNEKLGGLKAVAIAEDASKAITIFLRLFIDSVVFSGDKLIF